MHPPSPFGFNIQTIPIYLFSFFLPVPARSRSICLYLRCSLAQALVPLILSLLLFGWRALFSFYCVHICVSFDFCVSFVSHFKLSLFILFSTFLYVYEFVFVYNFRCFFCCFRSIFSICTLYRPLFIYQKKISISLYKNIYFHNCVLYTFLQCDFPPYQFHSFPDAVNLMVSFIALYTNSNTEKRNKLKPNINHKKAETQSQSYIHNHKCILLRNLLDQNDDYYYYPSTFYMITVHVPFRIVCFLFDC